MKLASIVASLMILFLATQPVALKAHWLSAPPPATATLLDGSDLVILGEVSNSRAEEVERVVIDPDGRRLNTKEIFTIYTFSVSKVLCGAWAGREIEVYTWGGDYEGSVTHWPSMRMMLPDGEVFVLFLAKSEGNDYWYAFQQKGGVFSVSERGGMNEVRGLIDENHLQAGNPDHEAFLEERNASVAKLIDEKPQVYCDGS